MVVQVDDERLEVRPKGRAGLKTFRRGGLEALGTAWADAAIKLHPCHVGRDRRNLDAVVSLQFRLYDARHIRPAMRAVRRHHVALARRIGMQRPMRAGVRLSLGLAARFLARLLAQRGRRAGIVRRLRRKAKFGFQFANPLAQFRVLRHQRLDPRQQRGDQSVLFGAR